MTDLSGYAKKSAANGGTRELLDELATDAGILDDAGNLALSSHVLRHTLATNLPRAGVGVGVGVDVVVVELLGPGSRPPAPAPRRGRRPGSGVRARLRSAVALDVGDHPAQDLQRGHVLLVADALVDLGAQLGHQLAEP